MNLHSPFTEDLFHENHPSLEALEKLSVWRIPSHLYYIGTLMTAISPAILLSV